MSVERLICSEGGGASISIRHPSRTFPSGVLGCPWVWAKVSN
ncbi:hypothetical protein [Corynebacterium durum]|nr:hypothetical protein [Corynebacterium durum]MDO4652661.1 hypothetical protein [Corynebacterium durum]